jgi:hypothetical protein
VTGTCLGPLGLPPKALLPSPWLPGGRPKEMSFHQRAGVARGAEEDLVRCMRRQSGVWFTICEEGPLWHDKQRA